MVVTAIILLISILLFGSVFFRLHTMPERMAHRSHKLQFEIVAVLGLLALFTHIHLFWVAGLLLAMVDIPDFGGSLSRIAVRPRSSPGSGRAKAPWTCRRASRSIAAQPCRRIPRPLRQAQGPDPCLRFFSARLLTIVPDYLFRRYVQNKRIGKEITIFSVWFELRWGITACLMLAVSLIATIFYNHPSTTNVTRFYRTVPIVSETNGRVAEVFVAANRPDRPGRADLQAGQLATGGRGGDRAPQDRRGRRGSALARIDIVKADGQLQEATSAHQQAVDELETKRELQRRNPGNVPFREIERLELVVEGRLGAITAATAAKQSATERVSAVLPGPESQRRSRIGPGRG